MSRMTASWLQAVSDRLEAVKREPAQEERNYDHESRAWSDLYQHAPSDLARATAALQAVLDLHSKDRWGDCSECSDWGDCSECADSWSPVWPCPTAQALIEQIEGPGA